MIGSLGALVQRQGRSVGNGIQRNLEDTLIGNPTSYARSDNNDAGLIRHLITLSGQPFA